MENKINQEHIEALALKAKLGTISDEEWQILDTWYSSHNDEIAYFSDKAVNKETIKASIFHHIQEKIQKKPNKYLFWMYRVGSAAILIISLGVLTHLYLDRENHKKPDHSIAAILPGKNQALLTLSNGDKMVLNDLTRGILSTESGVSIVKQPDGQVVYEVKVKNKEITPTGYHTFETPRAGQFQLKLPDGTQVWLNASSSIRFSTSLARNEIRKVELTGEAYFEVTKNPQHPFVVLTAGQEVEVLGTHFNINSYPEETTTKTTLVEGSVKVKILSGNKSLLLHPNQQSISSANEIYMKRIDPEAEIAWKNGLFVSEGQDFKTMMRAIGRWYDVDIVFEYDPVDLHVSMHISKTRNIKEVLKNLEATGDVHFVIEGRRVRVMK
ncbi:FecR family protein [Pedobacter sp.]|uniref:FecR family protein n=1 Tax=Pedobacter sp. TaxID=1411316 RepID=UPI003D7F6ECD